MNLRSLLMLGLLSSLVLAPTCWAQPPAAPAVPSALNLWNILQPSGELVAAIRIMSDEESDKIGEIKQTEAVDPTDAYYARVAAMSREEIVAGARKALASLQQANKASATVVTPVPASTPRPNSVFGIVSHAFSLSVSAGQPRQPFFSDLTRQLRGRQDFGAPVRFETVPLTRAENRPVPASTGTLGHVEIEPAP